MKFIIRKYFLIILVIFLILNFFYPKKVIHSIINVNIVYVDDDYNGSTPGWGCDTFFQNSRWCRCCR